MEDEEILTLQAEREKYIQETAFYKTKTKYINLIFKQKKVLVILNSRLI